LADASFASPLRNSSTWPRFRAPRTRSPLTARVSARFDSGTIRPSSDGSLRHRRATGRTPRTGLTVPSRPSSPTYAQRLLRLPGRCPAPASTATATGRSKAAPSLWTSAGARLTVMRRPGTRNPSCAAADRNLSLQSRAADGASPTIPIIGVPRRIATSTRTRSASSPRIAALWTLCTIPAW